MVRTGRRTGTLWHAAEAAEKRKDAKTGREYELALPAELDASVRKELARDFARELVERYGVVADVAIHEPGREGDNRNYHAHILTTTRTVGANGMGVKTRSLDVSSTASVEVEQLREVWAKQVNAVLECYQIGQRVDHRSFVRQGIEQEPTVHLGVAATGIERKAANERGAGLSAPNRDPVTDRGQQNAAVRERNRVLEAARKAAEKAQDLFSGLEKRARLAVNLARRIGQKMEQEREAERQRQKPLQQEVAQARFKGLSRGRRRSNDFSI